MHIDSYERLHTYVTKRLWLTNNKHAIFGKLFNTDQVVDCFISPSVNLPMPFSLCPCPDTDHSSWNVEVELFFDVVVLSKGFVRLSIPLLDSEAEFQLSLTSGQSRKSFVLHVNQVRCICMTIPPISFNILEDTVTYI